MESTLNFNGHNKGYGSEKNFKLLLFDNMILIG